MSFTREQILSLEPGQSLESEGRKVTHGCNAYNVNESSGSYRFQATYQEDVYSMTMSVEQVQDIAPEPWEFSFLEMDEHARRSGFHRLSGEAL